MKNLIRISALFLSFVMFSGFYSQDSNTALKTERVNDSIDIIKKLYKSDPHAKKLITSSYGYATFSNVGVNLILLSAEGGKGLAHDNKKRKNIYMNMGSAGVGIGIGVKSFDAIFIFENRKVFHDFVNNGWEANAQADLAIKAGKMGNAINKAVTVAPGIKLYKLTSAGLALQATIQGTKYWKDEDLN